MKLRGEFVVRQVMDCVAAIPVGATALQLNGMILLNDVSRVIWERLAEGATLEQIVTAITDDFEGSNEEAVADVKAFLEKLRQAQLLDEE